MSEAFRKELRTAVLEPPHRRTESQVPKILRFFAMFSQVDIVRLPPWHARQVAIIVEHIICHSKDPETLSHSALTGLVQKSSGVLLHLHSPCYKVGDPAEHVFYVSVGDICGVFVSTHSCARMFHLLSHNLNCAWSRPQSDPQRQHQNRRQEGQQQFRRVPICPL
jgi:hypothetical protein